MADTILAILASIFVVAGGAFLGYNYCKIQERYSRKENRLIGAADFYAIRAALMFVAGHGDEKVRAIKRKAFIALCKASEIYSNTSVEEIEEIAVVCFDAWLQARDEESEEYDACKEET